MTQSKKKLPDEGVPRATDGAVIDAFLRRSHRSRGREATPPAPNLTIERGTP